MAEHKETVAFRIPKYLKDWINQKVKSGEFATQSEFLIYVLSEYRSREDIRDLVREVVEEEMPEKIRDEIIAFFSTDAGKKFLKEIASTLE